MTILQEIQKWSEKQPNWQQDIIARLYGKADLEAEDYDDMYALLKSEHGIEDPHKRIPGKLAADQITAPQEAGRLVQIVAIKNLLNVNALAPHQRLPIKPVGLSVIYGENGTGKSGYSRVLKKACRARDKSEAIHPNANVAVAQREPAQASFEILVDGEEMEVEWIANQVSPEQLSSVSIFDSHCARAYVDNKGDFAYVPYGLDILSKLVDVCGKLKSLAGVDSATAMPNVAMFADLARTATKTGALLAKLSAITAPQEIETLATISADEQLRFEKLTLALAEADPKQKAQALRIKAIRFSELANRITAAASALDDAKVAELKKLIYESTVAKQAAEVARQDFKGAEGLLPGTGGDTWRALFEAARAFSAESHADSIFPHLGPEAACPLCQNLLTDTGDARLRAFEMFIHREAEKAHTIARSIAATAYQAVKNAQIDLSIDAGLAADLVTASQELANECSSAQVALNARREAILKASIPLGDWNAIAALAIPSSDALAAISTKMRVDAQILEDTMDVAAKAAMVVEHAELGARRRLSELKTAALECIEKFSLAGKLSKCALAASTTAPISRFSTVLSNSMATKQVVDALNAELQSLNVHELKVAMKPESLKGRTQFKLVLELPGALPAKDILSEGEQRAIALASFLTEVNLAPGRGGVVFDDPVSSLDHRRRWHVAKRLAQEATKRQVIVLTHDIYFLCILQQEADALGLELEPQCIRRAPDGFGVQSDRLPFDAMPTSKRVGALRQKQVAVAKAHKNGDEELAKRLTRDAYHDLRIAWERAVEEILLQGVVTRFTEGIKTQQLKYVEVKDDDVAIINAGMTKSSKFEHDAAAPAQLPTPHPDELSVDIETLEGWRIVVDARKKMLAARR